MFQQNMVLCRMVLSLPNLSILREPPDAAHALNRRIPQFLHCITTGQALSFLLREENGYD